MNIIFSLIGNYFEVIEFITDNIIVINIFTFILALLIVFFVIIKELLIKIYLIYKEEKEKEQ
jgi:hypothetical protein